MQFSRDRLPRNSPPLWCMLFRAFLNRYKNGRYPLALNLGHSLLTDLIKALGDFTGRNVYRIVLLKVIKRLKLCKTNAIWPVCLCHNPLRESLIYWISEDTSLKEMQFYMRSNNLSRKKNPQTKTPKTQQDNRTFCSLRILAPKG